MKKAAFLIIISICLPLTAQDYYRSNSLAMELERLEEAVALRDSENEWILEKRKNGNLLDYTLYNNGKVERSFVREYDSSGTLIYSSESSGGKLMEEVFYRTDGQIGEERFYLSDGTVEEVKLYRYSDEGLPLGVDLEKSGEKTASLNYSIRGDGSLRSVERTSEEDNQIRSSLNSYSGSLFMEEHVSGPVREISYHSGNGRLLSVIRFEENHMNLKEEREYGGDGILRKVTIENFDDNTQTVQIMNDSGAITREEVFRDRDLLSGTYYSYSSGKIVKKEKKEPGQREKWIYIYEDDDLAAEEYYRKDALEQIKRYSGEDQSSYLIELYDRNEIFMKVHYEEDVKIREEFISGGRVTRTRELTGE